MNLDVIVSDYLGENTYLVYNNKDLIIIDPGCEFDLIDKYITDNGFNLLCILVTHYHFDHVRSLNKLISKYKTVVYDYNNIGEININNYKIDILKTFGHTDDSVTFYFKDNNVMFTGDFLFKESIGRYDFENSSIEVMKQSIKYIKTFNENIIIYPGHGDKSTLKHEFNHNYYLNEEFLC